MVLFNIDNHKKDILAVDYKNKTIETKDKRNQINLLDTQYILGTNFLMPLLHMSKSYIWLEVQNQRINEFSIGYMMNPNFNRNRAFRDQVRVFLKNTLGPDTNIHIVKTLSKKKYKSDSIGYMLCEWEKNYKETVQSVELCNIYYYRQICLY